MLTIINISLRKKNKNLHFGEKKKISDNQWVGVFGDLKCMLCNLVIKIHKGTTVLSDCRGEAQSVLLTLRSASVAQPAGLLNACHCGSLRPSVTQLPDKVSSSIHFWALMLLRTNELLIMGVPRTVRVVFFLIIILFYFTLVTWLRGSRGK